MHANYNNLILDIAQTQRRSSKVERKHTHLDAIHKQYLYLKESGYRRGLCFQCLDYGRPTNSANHLPFKLLLYLLARKHFWVDCCCDNGRHAGEIVAKQTNNQEASKTITTLTVNTRLLLARHPGGYVPHQSKSTVTTVL